MRQPQTAILCFTRPQTTMTTTEPTSRFIWTATIIGWEMTGQPHSNWASQWYGSGWIGGSYTWNIPAVWSVGTSQTNPLSGWNQVHTLGPDGTMTVTKFGHSVSRTIQGNYSGH